MVRVNVKGNIDETLHAESVFLFKADVGFHAVVVSILAPFGCHYVEDRVRLAPFLSLEVADYKVVPYCLVVRLKRGGLSVVLCGKLVFAEVKSRQSSNLVTAWEEWTSLNSLSAVAFRSRIVLKIKFGKSAIEIRLVKIWF